MCLYTLIKIKIISHCVYQNDKSLDPATSRNLSYKWLDKIMDYKVFGYSIVYNNKWLETNGFA